MIEGYGNGWMLEAALCLSCFALFGVAMLSLFLYRALGILERHHKALDALHNPRVIAPYKQAEEPDQVVALWRELRKMRELSE